MTGKEFRKELKRIFKERGLDDKEIDFIGNRILTFRPTERSLAEELSEEMNFGKRCDIIDEFYDKPVHSILLDKKDLNRLVLKEDVL